MNTLSFDPSIFEKFAFEKTPVGIKFLYMKPEGILKLERKIALCEIVKRAQNSREPFFLEINDQSCPPANFTLGHDIPGVVESGHFGTALQIFKEPRANRKIYQILPRLTPGQVNFISVSPLDKLTFDPDLLIILTDNINQLEILSRAAGYTSGEMWNSLMTNVLACAWLYVYPYLNGEINYMTTGLSFGMNSRKVCPPGRHLVSIPYNRLPGIVQNLKDMPWVLPAYTDQGNEVVKRVFREMGLS